MCQSKSLREKDVIKHEYVLTDELRRFLKEPLGLLIPNDRLTYDEIISHINGSKMIITVGDATTERLIRLGITPSIQVVDGREMRIKRDLPLSKIKAQVRVSNPAGHISKEALMALSSAIRAEKPFRLIVDGEEDLLSLPSVALFPNGTSVLYGQPEKGIVIVKVNRDSRRTVISLLSRMVKRD